jgi:hypothetical protein
MSSNILLGCIYFLMAPHQSSSLPNSSYVNPKRSSNQRQHWSSTSVVAVLIDLFPDSFRLSPHYCPSPQAFFVRLASRHIASTPHCPSRGIILFIYHGCRRISPHRSVARAKGTVNSHPQHTPCQYDASLRHFSDSHERAHLTQLPTNFNPDGHQLAPLLD